MTEIQINAMLPETRPAPARKIFALGYIRYQSNTPSGSTEGAPLEAMDVLGLLFVQEETKLAASNQSLESMEG